jgi:hypothetical protein
MLFDKNQTLNYTVVANSQKNILQVLFDTFRNKINNQVSNYFLASIGDLQLKH